MIVRYGDTVTATATATATGFSFGTWSGGYVSGTTNPVTGAAVTANKTITASWYKADATIVDGYSVKVEMLTTDTSVTKTYGYALITNTTCDSSLTFTSQSNNNYTQSVSPTTPTDYYYCVKVVSDYGTRYVLSNSVSVSPKPLWIYYNVNGGSIYGTGTGYYANSSGWVVSENDPSSTAYIHQTCNYGSTCNLWNYNSGGWLLIKSGYMLEASGAWKARQGSSSPYTYTSGLSQTTDFTYATMRGYSQRDLSDHIEVNMFSNWITDDGWPIKVYYNGNGGSTSSSTYKVDTNGWVRTKSNNEYVMETVNSGGTLNLYNYSSTFGLQKSGKTAVTGGEWMISNGAMAYDEGVSNSYTLYKAASTKKSDHYELDLYVNWITGSGTYTITTTTCHLAISNAFGYCTPAISTDRGSCLAAGGQWTYTCSNGGYVVGSQCYLFSTTTTTTTGTTCEPVHSFDTCTSTEFVDSSNVTCS